MYHLWSNSPLCYSEPYYNLGLTLYYQNQLDEAYDVFYKATWSNEQQEMSFYYLAAIETGRGNLESALELVEKGLVKNAHNIKARGLKAVILRKLGRKEEAKAWCIENIKVDPFDYVSRFELAADAEEAQTILDEMNELMRDFHESYLQAARDYAEAKCYEEAVAILEQCTKEHPMLAYYKAYYYLGNLYYDKLQFEKAKDWLEKALVYPINLGEGRLEGTKDNNIYYYLGVVEAELGNTEKAGECFKKAELGVDEPAGAMYYYDQPVDMILYKGLANQKLGNKKAAYACFNKLMEYDFNHQNCRIYLKMVK